MGMVKTDFWDLRFDRKSRSPVLFLKEVGQDRFLPVWIGEYEATSIEIAALKRKPGRPLTHDLILSLLECTDVKLKEIRIDKLIGSTYYATLILTISGEERKLDARPSDGIALAIRQECPIYVEEDLLYEFDFQTGEEGTVLGGEPQAGGEDKTEEFKEFLSNLSPLDFEEPETTGGEPPSN